MGRTLVIYYSRTGHTRTVARDLARALNAEEEDIAPEESWSGAAGLLKAAWAAVRRAPARIRPIRRDWDAYDLVVVGTPVWAFTMAPPVRAFLEAYGARLRRVAFFCTLGGSGASRTFRHMEALCGRPPVATLTLTERELRAGAADRVRRFAATLP